MKKLFILLIVVIAFASCRRGGGDRVSCWMCSIEGNYKGKLVDIDTSMCNMNQAAINEFMAPYNTTEKVITCNRISAE
jgi:hypothetical protein